MSTKRPTHSYKDKRFCGREADKKLILMPLLLQPQWKNDTWNFIIAGVEKVLLRLLFLCSYNRFYHIHVGHHYLNFTYPVLKTYVLYDLLK